MARGGIKQLPRLGVSWTQAWQKARLALPFPPGAGPCLLGQAGRPGNEKIVIFLMRSVNFIKKSGKIYLIIFYILLSYNIYLSNYCYSYLYENFDAICELHLSNKIN